MSSKRIAAVAVTAALALGLTPATPAAAAPLPPVAALDPATIDLAGFTGLEQQIAPYLGNLARLANSVDDAGFITCNCWRTGQGPNDARVMENVLTLAYFYTADRPWNPYHRDPALRGRLEAALRFMLGTQNADGSFPQGSGDLHSRAATGFALELYAIMLDLLEADGTLDPALVTRLSAAMRAASGWFLEDEEVWGPRGAQFANQVAGGLVGISRLLARFGDLRPRFEERLAEHERVSQGEAGFFRDGTVAHRYSLEVESEDLAGWADPATRPVIDRMQARYLDWAQYNLLYDQGLDGYFINTAIDSRHRGWNYADELPIGSNNLWGSVIPQARAYAATREETDERRAAFAEAGWQTSVAPLIAPTWAYLDPSIIRDVALGEEYHPAAADRLAAVRTLRPYAGAPYTEHRADAVTGQRFVFAKRPSYVAGLGFGKHFDTQYGFWDNQRFGLSYLYDPKLGVVVQGQNAPQIGAPRTRPVDAELSWGTGWTAADGVHFDSYDQPVPAFYRDGAPVDPAAAGDLDDLEIRYASAGGTKSVTLDDRLQVRIDGATAPFFERIPLVLDKDDTVRWISGEGTRTGGASAAAGEGTTADRSVAVGEGTTADRSVAVGSRAEATDVSGVIVNRDGRSVEIRWSGTGSAVLWPSSLPVAGGRRTLQVLDLKATNTLAYDIRIVDDACVGSDERAQVFIGDRDTGVRNPDDGTGCTVADRLRATEQWDGHHAFVAHVTKTTTALARKGVLTRRDAARLVAAAARSDVGKNLVTASLSAAEAVAGTRLDVRLEGRSIREATVSGPCLTAEVTTTGPTQVTVRETTLPGPCPLTVRTVRTTGTVELDTLPLTIVPDAQGVVFRDGFSAPSQAWTAVDGTWSVTGGVYRQQDTTRTGWRTYVNGLTIADGTVETSIDFRTTATSTAFGGVQVRTARPGDAYTQSGYLVYLRPNGSVDVYRAGTGVLATGTGAAVTGPTRLRVELRGAELRAFVGDDPAPRVTVTDPDPITGAGSVQLVTGRAAVDFDDVRVTR
ncbi:hypothetical protein [Nonomuraea gerenzanensis]|uniref:Secreted protein n=1 Tax=Nonomuraea gerenzanensis TaxID=93944 RepID=A0A1M4EQS3_9ACTN|nr:hypothetical protein [Nonomuraea gerenzanensis]UBU12646.1 hypothetical protein LCN96_51725 [Nonomuraea gerenzanensis]SBP01201.1 hypothetical protein BN4615_P10717 [Nonomuraea gerenzanensis]